MLLDLDSVDCRNLRVRGKGEGEGLNDGYVGP